MMLELTMHWLLEITYIGGDDVCMYKEMCELLLFLVFGFWISSTVGLAKLFSKYL